LPVSRHVFDHIRLELNAAWVRALSCMHPGYRKAKSALRARRGILANIGCGPFGAAGWVNLDLYPHQNVTLRYDSRRALPFSDASCAGIHVEHFFEHLSHDDERAQFLAECQRCLAPGGVLRIIVPDAQLYISGYVSGGWEKLNAITCGGDVPQLVFRTKMEALNHIFLQGAEHYGGYDAETLELVLNSAGFDNVSHCAWREGGFPGGCIDREQHRPYSLYIEARA
jgi:predicted SAM-dependent methyltransferase